MNPVSASLRLFRRRPGPMLAAIAVLSLSLALFAALASALQGFLFRPSLVHDIDRVVRVREQVSAGAEHGAFSLSPPVFEAWRNAQTVFDDMAAATAHAVALQGSDGTGDSLRAALVTANFFDVLGVAPQLGRDFAAGEDRSGSDGVVLLSDAAWRNRFDADPRIVGRTLRIDGRARTVVGVMPPGLAHPYQAELWLPLRWDDALRDAAGNYLYVPARLRAGIDRAAAQASLSALAASIHAQHPEFGPTDAATLSPIRDEALGDLRPTLWLLFAAACFVLFVATLNTATTFYAQGLAEAPATTVRIALGARAGALLREALVRVGLIVAAAFALALALAERLLEPLFRLSGTASIREFDSAARLDAPTLAWIALAAVLVTVALAALDVRRAVKRVPAFALGVRGASSGREARRGLAIATVVQCALAFVLAAAALLAVLGYRHLRLQPRGFDSAQLLVGDLAFPLARYPTPASRDALLERLLGELRTQPGTVAAGASSVTPDYEGDWTSSFVVEGAAPLPPPGHLYTNHRLVTPGYFGAMRIALRSGRDFDAANPARDRDGVIVSRSFAALAWPDGNALGRRVLRVDGSGNTRAALTVIGVADDVVEAVRDPFAPAARSWYRPTVAGTDYDYTQMSIVLRTAAQPAQATAAMRAALARLDPDLAFAHLSTMDARLAQTLGREQLGSLLFALFAACSLLIAFAGIYGALAFLVETRRRDFGIRLALGARAARIVRAVVGDALAIAALGLAGGIVVALAAARVIASVVQGVGAADAWLLAPLALVLLALAAAVGYAVARRAARIEPIEILRSE